MLRGYFLNWAPNTNVTHEVLSRVSVVQQWTLNEDRFRQKNWGDGIQWKIEFPVDGMAQGCCSSGCQYPQRHPYNDAGLVQATQGIKTIKKFCYLIVTPACCEVLKQQSRWDFGEHGCNLEG